MKRIKPWSQYWHDRWQRADRRAKKWRSWFKEANDMFHFMNGRSNEWRDRYVKQSKIKTYWKILFFILTGETATYLIFR